MPSDSRIKTHRSFFSYVFLAILLSTPPLIAAANSNITANDGLLISTAINSLGPFTKDTSVTIKMPPEILQHGLENLVIKTKERVPDSESAIKISIFSKIPQEDDRGQKTTQPAYPEILKIFQITPAQGLADRIAEANITFSFLSNKSGSPINPVDIAFLRFADGKWNELPIVHRPRDNRLEFTSTASAFSIFVAASKNKKQTQLPATEAPNTQHASTSLSNASKSTATGLASSNMPNRLIYGIVFILILLAIGGFLYTRKGESGDSQNTSPHQQMPTEPIPSQPKAPKPDSQVQDLTQIMDRLNALMEEVKAMKQIQQQTQKPQ